MIGQFETDAGYQLYLGHTINNLAALCAELSQAKGFHEDEERMRELLEGQPEMLSWFETQLIQAELARAMSECGEAIEGIRNPHRDKHVPEMDNAVVELADAVIRILDIAGKRQLPIGKALVEKLLANAARPKKHGKNS